MCWEASQGDRRGTGIRTNGSHHVLDRECGKETPPFPTTQRLRGQCCDKVEGKAGTMRKGSVLNREKQRPRSSGTDDLMD